MVRPKKKPGESKDSYIRVRVTKAERAKVLARWKSSSVKTESDWIRDLLLNGTTDGGKQAKTGKDASQKPRSRVRTKQSAAVEGKVSS
jgi:hypothetical protein